MLVNYKNLCQLFLHVRKAAKHFTIYLSKKDQIPKCCEKWNRKLDRNVNWKTIFFKIKKIKEVKLKWFQIRIIHRIIATNRTLSWMNLRNDELCSFCNEEDESIEHLFWECDVVQQFWTRLMTLISEKCDVDFELNEELTILGCIRGKKSDDVFDFIVLFAKFYIYSCKQGGNLPEINVFIKRLHNRFLIDKHLSYMDMNYRQYLTKWQPYLNIFEM